MCSYTEFKKELKNIHDISEKEIFYIVGVMFEKTNGFSESHKEKFYGLRENTVFDIKWSIDSYGWDIEVDEW
jgi:hypothetical protein